MYDVCCSYDPKTIHFHDPVRQSSYERLPALPRPVAAADSCKYACGAKNNQNI